jgi:hypothetical protein
VTHRADPIRYGDVRNDGLQRRWQVELVGHGILVDVEEVGHGRTRLDC